MARISFNSSNAPKRDHSVMPVAEYLFSITSSDVKASAKTPGAQHIALEFTCLDEGFKGRKMFTYINIEHPKPDVKRIAEAEFRELVEACGKGGQMITDTSVLHGIPILIKTKIVKDKDGVYEDKAAPVWYKPGNTPRSAAAAPTAGFKPPVAAASGFKPPVVNRAQSQAQAHAAQSEADLSPEQRAAIEADHTVAISKAQLDRAVAEANEQAQAQEDAGVQQAAAPTPAPAPAGAPAWMRRTS